MESKQKFKVKCESCYSLFEIELLTKLVRSRPFSIVETYIKCNCGKESHVIYDDRVTYNIQKNINLMNEEFKRANEKTKYSIMKQLDDAKENKKKRHLELKKMME